MTEPQQHAALRIIAMRESFNDEGKAMIDEIMELVEAEINDAVEKIGRHHFLPLKTYPPNFIEILKDRLRMVCFWRVAHGMQPGSDDPWPLLLTDK